MEEDEIQKKPRRSRAYGGSKTSRFDYPEGIAAVPPTTHTSKQEAVGSKKASSPKPAREKPSRYKKRYAGSKTSYGDAGASTYDSGYNRSTYADSKPSYRNYDNRYTSAASNHYEPVSSKRYEGASTTAYTPSYKYEPSSHYSSRYNTGNRYDSPRTYSKYSNHPSRYGDGYTGSSYSSYQPATAESSYRQEAKPKRYEAPAQRDTGNNADTTFKTVATLKLEQGENMSPEHDVSDAIEKKATRYGGRYETKDGKIYYGQKPSNYNKNKKKRYDQKRKTMHYDRVPAEEGKSDRTSF